MNISSKYERESRGTPDFPIELYVVDNTHVRYNMQSHWHKEYELIYIEDGGFDLYLDEKNVQLGAHDSVFIPEGTIHSGTPNNAKYKCLVFPSSVLSATQKSRAFTKNHLSTPVLMHSEPLVKELISAFEKRDAGYECTFVAYLYLLCAEMSKHNKASVAIPNIRMEKIKTALSFIEKNFSSDISLESLSDACHMSPNYFCRFFKEITHETPMEYVLRYRLECARTLLSEEMSITEIAYECGFNDASYFINNFKKHFGITPNKYRKSDRK